MEHTTEYLGYLVKETTHGLDAYDEYGSFACEISGMRLDDFRFDGKISDAELEQAIKEQIEIEAFLDEQGGYL